MFLSSGPERAGWEGGQHGGQERWWGRRVRVLLTCEARWGFVPVRGVDPVDPSRAQALSLAAFQRRLRTCYKLGHGVSSITGCSYHSDRVTRYRHRLFTRPNFSGSARNSAAAVAVEVVPFSTDLWAPSIVPGRDGRC